MSVQAPVRVPFAPLDNPRLQHLANAKNRQNGLVSQMSSASTTGKPSIIKRVLSPGKRSFEPSAFDDFDSENVDPVVFDSPTKKSKNEAFDTPTKPFAFMLTPQKSVPLSSRLSTPARANVGSPRAPMTAPAGRSPKRKIAGIGKNRRISAPFTRIEPPFASRASSLPFSLNAALSGTFAQPEAKSSTKAPESMPKNWFFDIYEDTPEEEAANLMEHSTLTLDLSSDEESSKKERNERGKENTPPEGYDAPTASRSSTGAGPKVEKKSEIVRKKIDVEEMDDGQRSPLSALETAPFIPQGLEKDCHVIVEEAKEDVAGSVAVTATERVSEVVGMPPANEEADKEAIVVWEDAKECA